MRSARSATPSCIAHRPAIARSTSQATIAAPARGSPSTSAAGDRRAGERHRRDWARGWSRACALERHARRRRIDEEEARRRRRRCAPAPGCARRGAPRARRVFVPSSRQPSPSRRRRVAGRDGSSPPASISAAVRTIVARDDARQPALRAAPRCRTAPIGSAPSTSVAQTGTGATARADLLEQESTARSAEAAAAVRPRAARRRAGSPSRARPQLAVEAVRRSSRSAFRRSCVAWSVEDLARELARAPSARRVKAKSIVRRSSVSRVAACRRPAMAMMSRCTSLVPPPKVRISAVRYMRSSRPARSAPRRAAA